MKPVLISFSGIDGAGKSTQIEKLRRHLDAAGIPVTQYAFWDDVAVCARLRASLSRWVLGSDGAVGAPERPAARRDKNVQAWPLLLCRGLLHLLDAINLRRVIRRTKSATTGVVIFDRYIYDHLAALPLDSALARTYARVLIRLAPRPDIAYLLDALPEAARARKPEYPLEFMRRNRSSYLELQEIAELQLIPAGDPDDVHSAILDCWSGSPPGASQSSEISSAMVI